MDEQTKSKNKALAAALAAGLALGAGGRSLLDTAHAAPPPFTHAVDLRRDFGAADAGTLRLQVYGTRTDDKGQQKDIGLAPRCKPSPETLKLLSAGMDALAAECDWP